MAKHKLRSIFYTCDIDCPFKAHVPDKGGICIFAKGIYIVLSEYEKIAENCPRRKDLLKRLKEEKAEHP